MAARVGGEGMELIDIVIVAGVFGVFNTLLYVAATLMLIEHEKKISGRRT